MDNPHACPMCGEVHHGPLQACVWCIATVTAEWVQMRRESAQTQEDMTP